jgi:hypothetical protein
MVDKASALQPVNPTTTATNSNTRVNIIMVNESDKAVPVNVKKRGPSSTRRPLTARWLASDRAEL